MEKKYILTEETKEVGGHILHKIQAVRDFGGVQKGDLGGWVESEENLSHDGDCWIFDNGRVFGNGEVYDNGKVSGNGKVFDNGWVYDNGWVFGNGEVYGNGRVFGNGEVYGNGEVSGDGKVFDNGRVYGDGRVSDNGWVFGDGKVFGNGEVYGNGRVSDDGWVFGNAKIGFNAYISSPRSYFVQGPIGSRDDFLTCYLDKDKKIYAVTGCFSGTLEEFEKKVKETHGSNKHAKQYLKAAEMARVMLSED